jgi:hypothetical protein
VIHPARARFAVAALVMLAMSRAHVGLAAPPDTPTTLSERVRGANTVVIARARDAVATWHTNERGDQIIVTRVLLDVEEPLKGSGGEPILMEIPGGTVDGVTLKVSGQPMVQRGDRAVFFLDQPQGGIQRPYRRAEGVLKLDGHDVVRGSTLRLAEVRQSVRSSAGKPVRSTGK